MAAIQGSARVMTGYLTTHILDTANGVPAAGVRIELFRRNERLAEMTTNGDGRTDAPVIAKGQLQRGAYELRFHIGDYFGAARFLDVVPVAFQIEDTNAHYHVPLLVSPFGYSTYRGS
jgi:5-hydroxyisourate hydrolase